VRKTPKLPALTIQSLPDDLPAAAWECLFRVTLERLSRCKPQWAKITGKEAAELELTWQVCGLAQDTLKAERWLSDVQEFLHQEKLPERGRTPFEPSSDWLLWKYETLRDGIQAMRRAERKKNPKDIDAFYLERLGNLFQDFGPVWLDKEQPSGKPCNKIANVSPQIIAIAKSEETPSSAAILIIGSLWRRSPEALKNSFLISRRSKNPLHIWQQALRPPRS
jgi:hypothetical protein